MDCLFFTERNHTAKVGDLQGEPVSWTCAREPRKGYARAMDRVWACFVAVAVAAARRALCFVLCAWSATASLSLVLGLRLRRCALCLVCDCVAVLSPWSLVLGPWSSLGLERSAFSSSWHLLPWDAHDIERERFFMID